MIRSVRRAAALTLTVAALTAAALTALTACSSDPAAGGPGPSSASAASGGGPAAMTGVADRSFGVATARSAVDPSSVRFAATKAYQLPTLDLPEALRLAAVELG